MDRQWVRTHQLSMGDVMATGPVHASVERVVLSTVAIVKDEACRDAYICDRETELGKMSGAF